MASFDNVGCVVLDLTICGQRRDKYFINNCFQWCLKVKHIL